MSLAVVLGRAVADLAEGPDLAGVAVRVRHGSESAAERGTGLRDMLGEAVDTVLVVDAAAPARPDWMAGGPRLALVADHIGLTGDNPLVGANDDAWGPRFPDLTDAWDPRLRAALRAAAAGARIELREGIVAVVSSDLLTAAELSMLRTLGADMVSTGFADEAIIARHAGRRVAGIAVFAPASGSPGADQPPDVSALLRAALRVLDGSGRAA